MIVNHVMETEPVDRVVTVANDEVSDSAHHDRRRPGRNANSNPDLIPLLRGTVRTNTTSFIEFVKRPDTLSTARGIMLGVLLSVLIWAPVALTVWFLG